MTGQGFLRSRAAISVALDSLAAEKQTVECFLDLLCLPTLKAGGQGTSSKIRCWSIAEGQRQGFCSLVRAAFRSASTDCGVVARPRGTIFQTARQRGSHPQMHDFLAQNIEILNAFLNGLLVLIWAVYLQIFLVSHLRQARSVIHIDIGAADGERSRCLVTNLSSNPLYVQGMVADLLGDESSTRVTITEREEIDQTDLEDPLARTNRGTLQPGQTIDVGSLADVLNRAWIRLGQRWSIDGLVQVKVTVIAISGQAERVVGASKTFDAKYLNGRSHFVPQSVLTHQIRPRRARTAFSDLMNDQSEE